MTDSGMTPRLPSVAVSSLSIFPSIDKFWSKGATENACMICANTMRHADFVQRKNIPLNYAKIPRSEDKHMPFDATWDFILISLSISSQLYSLDYSFHVSLFMNKHSLDQKRLTCIFSSFSV